MKNLITWVLKILVMAKEKTVKAFVTIPSFQYLKPSLHCHKQTYLTYSTI